MITGLSIVYFLCLYPTFGFKAVLTHSQFTPLLFDVGIYMVVVGVIGSVMSAMIHNTEQLP